jgi:cyclopropane-fatty-acyl-phospholipid synthase
VSTQPSIVTRPLIAAARAALFRAIRDLEVGYLVFEEPGGACSFGDPSSSLRARITVHDPRLYLAAALGGSVGAGRAYTNGWWTAEPLETVIQVLSENAPALSRWRLGLSRIAAPMLNAAHAVRRNTQRGSKRNIAAHYDLGNDFFALFLDDTLTYSCGIFPHPKATLREASVEKLDRVCRKLNLGPGDHVLEIGTGWGSFAIHAAREYGCRVTTTTISARQHAFASRRVEEAGLANRVQVIRRDYRELDGTFDKLVSIEMIEAVGHHYFDAFFRVCSDRLKPSGAMLLQAIVIDDRFYEQARQSVDFIKRYVFPGSCIPSVEAIQTSVRRVTDLRPVDLEDITPHYAETLQHWRRRFVANRDRVESLGFDRAFSRLWEFYLAYCEGGFRARRIGDVQLLLAKPESDVVGGLVT